MENVTAPVGDCITNATNSSMYYSQVSVHERYTQAELFGAYSPANSIVDKYVTPIWYIVGFPGNLLAVLVWVQPRMRHSSGCYLATLAMADFVFLILQLLFELQNTWGVRILTVRALCEAFPIFFMASQYLSPLLVLGFTVERYISICHPFQREKYCSTSRAVRVSAGLVVLSLALHAIQGYFWHYADSDCSPRQQRATDVLLWTVWSWVTELLVFGLVPMTILLLNILVIKEAKKLSDNEEKVLCLKKGSKSGASATTFMLLAVSFYLIFTTVPVTVCYAMFHSFPSGDPCLTDAGLRADPTWTAHLHYWTVRTIVQELGMSHYACNFFIYLLTGHAFRRELSRLLCRRCPQWGAHGGGGGRRQWNGEFQEVRTTTSGTAVTTNGAAAHL